ncbi:MAG: alkylhydroperoxidase-related (seleno)protein [Acidimicrobiia bacterium]
MTTITDLGVRSDLVAAHRQAWGALGRPGTWWTGIQRVELAATAVAAMTDDNLLPPWTAPSTVDGGLAGDLAAPAVAHDAIYRIAAHAGTLSESWYRQVRDELGDLAYVEVVGIACTVAAVVAFRRAAGLAPRELPRPVEGEPSRDVPPDLVPAGLNWVRVTSPADEVAAVVQAFSSVPAEFQRLWMLADAQYIPNLEMVDPHWTRGTVSRAQMELVATRVSKLRECFY